MSLWIARVKADDSYGVASVREADTVRNIVTGARVPLVGRDEFLVAADTEGQAHTIAMRILQRAKQRAIRESAGDLERNGYGRALDDLAAFLDDQRAQQADRPSGQYAGVTEGRLDMLDAIERWALAMRPKGT